MNEMRVSPVRTGRFVLGLAAGAALAIGVIGLDRSRDAEMALGFVQVPSDKPAQNSTAQQNQLTLLMSKFLTHERRFQKQMFGGQRTVLATVSPTAGIHSRRNTGHVRWFVSTSELPVPGITIGKQGTDDRG